MAIAHEELVPRHREAVVYPFPTVRVRARAAALRRRRALAHLGLAVALVAATVAAAARFETGSVVHSRAGAPAQITVASGQSLWRIATRYAAPGTDLRVYVTRLEQLNGVSGAVAPGDRLRLPR